MRDKRSNHNKKGKENDKKISEPKRSTPECWKNKNKTESTNSKLGNVEPKNS